MNVVEVIEAEIEEAVLVIGGQPVAEEKLRNPKTSEQFSFETCHTPSMKSQ